MKSDYLQSRLKLLENDLKQTDANIQQLLANRNLLQGAVQEITLLLQEMKFPSPEAPNVVATMTADQFKDMVGNATPND